MELMYASIMIIIVYLCISFFLDEIEIEIDSDFGFSINALILGLALSLMTSGYAKENLVNDITLTITAIGSFIIGYMINIKIFEYIKSKESEPVDSIESLIGLQGMVILSGKDFVEIKVYNKIYISKIYLAKCNQSDIQLKKKDIVDIIGKEGNYLIIKKSDNQNILQEIEKLLIEVK